MDTQNKDQTLFPDINADEESGVTSIESLCVSCEENVSLCRWYSWVSLGKLYTSWFLWQESLINPFLPKGFPIDE